MSSVVKREKAKSHRVKLQEEVLQVWQGLVVEKIDNMEKSHHQNSPRNHQPKNSGPAIRTRSQSQQQTRDTRASKGILSKRTSTSSHDARNIPEVKSLKIQNSAMVSNRPARKMSRKQSSYHNDQDPDDNRKNEEEIEVPEWDAFTSHVKSCSNLSKFMFTDTSRINGIIQNLLNSKGSDICKKICRDMKEQIDRKRLAQAKASESENSQSAENKTEEELVSEEESEDEEEVRRKRLKAEAQRYWELIRREIQERIRIRKEKNPAGGTWNSLRSQLRAVTRADLVRKELYEKYGIIPKEGQKYPEDTMKPNLSADVNNIISRFNAIKIPRLRSSFFY